MRLRVRRVIPVGTIRPAEALQVERDDAMGLRQRGDDRAPGFDGGGEAMNQHDRRLFGRRGSGVVVRIVVGLRCSSRQRLGALGIEVANASSVYIREARVARLADHWSLVKGETADE